MSNLTVAKQKRKLMLMGTQTHEIIEDVMGNEDEVHPTLHLALKACRFDLNSNVNALSQFLMA